MATSFKLPLTPVIQHACPMKVPPYILTKWLEENSDVPADMWEYVVSMSTENALYEDLTKFYIALRGIDHMSSNISVPAHILSSSFGYEHITYDQTSTYTGDGFTAGYTDDPDGIPGELYGDGRLDCYGNAYGDGYGNGDMYYTLQLNGDGYGEGYVLGRRRTDDYLPWSLVQVTNG